MSRLAEYVQDLANLFGEKAYVHFVCVEEGSTTLVQKIDPESVVRIRAHINAIGVTGGERAEGALRAFKAINRRLAGDNTVGHL